MDDDTKFFVGLLVIWILGALASLAVLGVVIWAII